MPTVNHYHVSENYFEGYWYICIHLKLILLVEKKTISINEQSPNWPMRFGIGTLK